MGRQIRKVAPWMGMVESHMHSNHVVHRLYRWSAYHSHPTMKAGGTFKTRAYGRPYPGMLLTPEASIFKLPVGLAFVAVNPNYNPRVKTHKKETHQKNELISASKFKIDENCQKTVMNYNKCLVNNSQTASETCFYYLNYLNNNCRQTQ